MIHFAAICPHPPIMVPGIGKGDDLEMVQNTIAAMGNLRDQFERAKIETVIIVSPHAPIAPNIFLINMAPVLKGSFHQFGLDSSLSFQNDSELTQRIQVSDGVMVTTHESHLDHGALVPLYYLLRNSSPTLIHLSFSFLDLRTHYHYGQTLMKILESSPKRIAVVASGDLSHRLTPHAPAGYSPQGKKFDETLIQYLEKNEKEKILNLNEDFIEEAGECGLRSFIILLGIVEKKKWNFQKLCYEGPFGVGYLTARLV